MNTMQGIKSEFLLRFTTENWKREETHTKTSFWPTDVEKPGIEIFWRWANEPTTNPIGPETLLMFRAAAAFEHAIVKHMVECGEAVDLDNVELVESMGHKIIQREGDIPQVRIDMERNFIPITGYLDALSPEGIPIEVKTYYSSRVDKELARGKAPSSHYLKQLAVQIDYCKTLTGILVSANRSTGNIFFTELRRQSLDTLVFEVGDRSMDMSEPDVDEERDGERRGSDEDEGPDSVASECGEIYGFDLQDEYDRWRALMENHIIPLREPPLDYSYKAELTKELLDYYAGKDGKFTEIRRAIKGQRVLSDHRWRPQYSNYKDLWIEREMKQKGFKTVAELCTYTPTEIMFLMDYANLEFQKTKDGKWKRDPSGARKLFTRKG